MDWSEVINARGRPTGREGPSTSPTTAIDTEQLAYYNNLRGERNRRVSDQALHPVSSEHDDDLADDEGYPGETPRGRSSPTNHDRFKLRPQVHYSRRKHYFDDQNQVTFPRPQSGYNYNSKPYQTSLSPPPESAYSGRTKERRITIYNDSSPGFSGYEHHIEPRHPRRARSYERQRPTVAPGEEYWRGMPFHNPPSPGYDSVRPQKFWDTYNSDPNISGYRSGELQIRNAALPPETRNVQPGFQERDGHVYPPYLSNQLIKASSSYRPTDPRPFPRRPSYPRRHELGRNTHTYNLQDHEVDSESYSSDDDDAWVESDDSDSQGPPQSDAPPDRTNTSQVIRLHSNILADEDLVNPSDWNQRLTVTENAVKAHHQNRKNWPDTWRHSDSKNCPKALSNVWTQILDVDHRVNQLGLDAAPPTIDNSKYQLRKTENLADLITVFKARPLQDRENAMHTFPTSPSLTDRDKSWDNTCEQIQRLLKVRDYLIAVCRDAEFLNDFHPTMDAITWFERAQSVDNTGLRTGRRKVIELMSLKILHLSEIITSLNVILQALVWSWSEQSTACIHSDQEAADKQEQDAVNGLTKESMLEHTRPKIISSNTYDNSEKRIQTCIHTPEIGLEALTQELEVFAAILSQALFYQCDVLISEDQSRGEVVSYGGLGYPGLMFHPQGLQCMGDLIQYRNVWVLEQFHDGRSNYPYVCPPAVSFTERDLSPPFRPLSFVRATIMDLARIWGPIWKASELTEGNSWLWYRLPGGYIGAPGHQSFQIATEVDEAPSHFSTTMSGDFGECPSSQFFVPNLPYLLIGHGLPDGLVSRNSCPMNLETGLEGMALQSIGTVKPFKYKDSSSFNIAVGHGGAQVSWSTQIKINPGILMKQSLLDRWMLEPQFRNPRLLLLWYGVEVSLCTRNARRCRLVDIIQSRPMIQYLSTIYRPGVGSGTYKETLFDALNSTNPNAFIELYDKHPEWQGELGKVVARCLDVLGKSGVNRKGDLVAFAFIKKFDDPEQLAILRRKNHTWTPLLKDSFQSATFAFMSSQCLRYPKAPGQGCRVKDRAGQASKSVLETSYTSTKRSDMIGMFKSRKMQVNQKLIMNDSSYFNIKKRSSKGIILGAWHGGPSRYFHIPRPSEERFQEKRQDAEKAIRTFVVSSKKCKLPRLLEIPRVAPVTKGDDKVSICAPSSDEEPDTPSSRPYQSASNPSFSEKSSTAAGNLSSSRESRTLNMEDTSGLRKNGAQRVDIGSQTSSSNTKPQGSAAMQISPPGGDGEPRVHKATQTDMPTVIQPPLATPSPTTNGEFLLPIPANGESSRRDSGSDAGSGSTRRSHRKSSGSHEESNGSSSHRRHRHRRSHGDSPVEENYPKEDSLRSKLGLGFRR